MRKIPEKLREVTVRNTNRRLAVIEKKILAGEKKKSGNNAKK